MIAKVEVRKRLVLYEDELKKERKLIAQELVTTKNSCRTKKMLKIWYESKEYADLHARYEMLDKIVKDIIDIRCEEMFNDD